MSYRLGMAYIHDGVYSDYGENSDGKPVDPPVVLLPHSCEEWVIGGLDQVRAMIADLQSIEQMLETPK